MSGQVAADSEKEFGNNIQKYADGRLVKPFNQKEIITIIDWVMNGRNSDDEMLD